MKRLLLPVLTLSLLCTNASHAILMDRGPNMVYDDVLNITWTRQAGDGVLRTWDDANTWAMNLIVDGLSGWRLPYASVGAGVGPITTLPAPFPCDGFGGADEVACRDNEMAYMFYYNLGGNAGANLTGDQAAVGGEVLTGIQPIYWSGTEFDPFDAWFYFFRDGAHSFFDKGRVSFGAWAVRPGDVNQVPEPSSLLLLGAGLAGLVGFGRRKHRSRFNT